MLTHVAFGALSVMTSVVALFVVIVGKRSLYLKLFKIIGTLSLLSIISGTVLLAQEMFSSSFLQYCLRFGLYIVFIGMVEGALLNSFLRSREYQTDKSENYSK